MKTVFQNVFKNQRIQFWPVMDATQTEMITAALRIYVSSQAYFDLAQSGQVTFRSVLQDLSSLPPNGERKDKLFGLIAIDGLLVAVLDGILHYPDEDCFSIGLLLVDASLHSCGFGSRILRKLGQTAAEMGYRRIRLGVLQENQRAFNFWLRQGFIKMKTVKRSIHPESNWTVRIMEKKI